MKQQAEYDLVIIGGGINGCGIAADAAMRGLKVLLIEKDDLASKTSSSSSKLIHGGLRYLEQYDFHLVKKALDERQVLLQIAPHLVHPQAFVLPYKKQLRPAWFMRLGLFIYDHLSRKNNLPHSVSIHRKTHRDLFAPLASNYKKGFLFYDCKTDDARLTISNALQAQQHGATILTHTALISGKSVAGIWQLTLQTRDTKPVSITTRVIINAAGPWVEKINACLGMANPCHLSLIKGSHIVVPKLYTGDQAYFLQNQDKRDEFIVPYQGETKIGTTEVKLSAPAESNTISQEEINYLINAVGAYFKQPIKTADILSSWSGIRPLIEHKHTDPSAMSRDYILQYTTSPAPCVVVYGGKITTYRLLAKEAVNLVHTAFPNLTASKTDVTPLPGSNFPKGMTLSQYAKHIDTQYSWLPHCIKTRLLQSYGTILETILSNCHSIDSLGTHFGHGLYQVEVDYLIKTEWASDASDILWRRTKLGLQFNQEEVQALSDYVETV